MSEIIIKVENLGKRFVIGHRLEGDFRRSMINSFKYLIGRKGDPSFQEFWALKNVSFQVNRGEAIGIIGRNGAGKSTLLKILSRITSPTTGRFEMNGRVSSLLEVGTGFHPELTGRENVYLNGTILGMRRSEIKKSFDEIVEFSGVEKFIDTPVKHYSSGMKVRLAFSVAAFLEPEILIIDEVLAVGDIEFQKKCLGKMNEVSHSHGRTILFVSHNMAAVENLCQSAILLDKGNITVTGPVEDVILAYHQKSSEEISSNFRDLSNADKRQGNGKIKFVSIEFSELIKVNDSVWFEFELYNANAEVEEEFFLAITIFDSQGMKLVTLDNLYSSQKMVVKPSHFKIRCEIPNFCLLPGSYIVDLWLSDSYDIFDQVENAATFSVEPTDVYKTGKLHNKTKHGYFLIPNIWRNV